MYFWTSNLSYMSLNYFELWRACNWRSLEMFKTIWTNLIPCNLLSVNKLSKVKACTVWERSKHDANWTKRTTVSLVKLNPSTDKSIFKPCFQARNRSQGQKQNTHTSTICCNNSITGCKANMHGAKGTQQNTQKPTQQTAETMSSFG